MLRLIPATPPLTPAEQFALAVLIDQSRLLVVDEGIGEGVALHVANGGSAPTIADARAKRWCIEAKDGGVEVQRPLLSLVAELAGSVMEQRSGAEDHFGRVPPTENALVRRGEEREPIVGQIAVALRKAAIAAAARRQTVMFAPWPQGKRWAVAMTHDLDVVNAWPVFSALRLAELAARGQVQRLARVIGSGIAAIGRDPVLRAATAVLDADREHGIQATWFVLAGTPTWATFRAGDLTYAPESARARAIIRAVADGGHELSLHGSFATYLSEPTFVAQRKRLATITSSSVPGVRQHFVRMRPGETHVLMSGAGFEYDSTYGFSERNGFRLGVADVVPVWNEREQRVLDLQEAPFVWMDRALSKYRAIEDPRVWIDDAFEIAKLCREVDGLWTGIWHPNLVPELGFPGAPAAYGALLAGLAQHSPWSASLAQIVQWRHARRTARAAISDGGPITLRVAPGSPPLTLEDATGRAVPHVVA